MIITEIRGLQSLIPAKKIFGKDAAKAEELCKTIFHYGLYGNRKLYKAPHPNLSELKDLSTLWNMSLHDTLLRWQTINVPDELAKQQCEESANHDKIQKAFRSLYGIAKRHHVKITWHGESCVACEPDRFTVFKNGKEIAKIQL